MPQTKSTAEAFETSRLISSESRLSTKYLTWCNLKSPLKTEARMELEPKCVIGKWRRLTSAETFVATKRSVSLNLMKFIFTFYTNCLYFYFDNHRHCLVASELQWVVMQLAPPPPIVYAHPGCGRSQVASPRSNIWGVFFLSTSLVRFYLPNWGRKADNTGRPNNMAKKKKGIQTSTFLVNFFRFARPRSRPLAWQFHIDNNR